MKPIYLSILTRYLLAEFILFIPSVDDLTVITKFLVQVILLVTAVAELIRRWKQKRANKSEKMERGGNKA